VRIESVQAGGGDSNQFVTGIYRRLIALSEETFAEATLDGAVYPAIQKVLADHGLEPNELTAQQGGRAVADALCSVSTFFLSAEEVLRFKERLAELIGEERVFDTVRLGIVREDDIVTARDAAREAGEQAGLSLVQTLKIVTVVSELARNIVRYTSGGEILLNGGNRSVRVVAKDKGPGIKDLEAILDTPVIRRIG